jgi:hypothetical protein
LRNALPKTSNQKNKKANARLLIAQTTQKAENIKLRWKSGGRLLMLWYRCRKKQQTSGA